MTNSSKGGKKMQGGLVDLTEAISNLTGESGTKGLLGGENGYGVSYENDVFMMHPFCWCEKDDCGWCAGIGAMPKLLRDVYNVKYAESERLPNFLYKPTGYKLWWYKYIGRGEESKGKLPNDWYQKCIESLTPTKPI
jgi:hypothetical protein